MSPRRTRGFLSSGWVSLHRLSMGRRLHERARIFNDLLRGCVRDAKEQGRKGCVFCLPKDASANSSPTRNTLRTRVSWLRTRHHAESCSCTCRSVPDTEPPQFKECAKYPTADGDGFVLYYTDQCPFTHYWVPRVEAVAEEHNIPLKPFTSSAVSRPRICQLRSRPTRCSRTASS